MKIKTQNVGQLPETCYSILLVFLSKIDFKHISFQFCFQTMSLSQTLVVFHPSSEIPDDTFWLKAIHKDAFIATFLYTPIYQKALRLVLKSNPTDSRVRFILAPVITCKDDLNRAPTAEELTSLMNVSAFMMSLNPLFQMSVAGNNSMDQVGDSTIRFGAKEPFACHAHFMFRDVPGQISASGVPYNGPPIGDEFHMKGPKQPYHRGAEALVAKEEKEIPGSLAYLSTKMAHAIVSPKVDWPYWNSKGVFLESTRIRFVSTQGSSAPLEASVV